MKGYYVYFLCNDLPSLRWLHDEYVKGPFTAAYHEHFDDGWVVELACETQILPELPRPLEWKDHAVRQVHVLEFFSNSLIEVGGVYVDETGVIDDAIEYASPSEDWKKRVGQLCFALDCVDISHPRAIHASDYSA